MKTTGIKWVAAAIGVLGIIGGAREQAWANDIAFRGVVRGTDFRSAGISGLRNTGSGTITLSGLSGTVRQARLYWAGPSNTTNSSANASITFNGQAVRGEQIGFTSDNCWGFDNSQAYQADVTSIVAAKGNGAYAISGLMKQGTNITANGASLLVFYDDRNAANDRDIVLFDGNDSNAPNPYDMPGWNIRLLGIRYLTGSASVELHVSDGQVFRDGAIGVNGTVLLAAGDIFSGASLPSAYSEPAHNGNLWDIRQFNVTSFLRPGTNALQMTHRWINPGGDCVGLVAAVINLPAGAAPADGPDLYNTAPSVLTDPDLTINTPAPVVVHADVIDIDGDALTTAISVNGVLMYTGTIEKGAPKTTGTLQLTNAFVLGDHSVIFAATDGRLASDSIMALRVVDNTPPVLKLPANIVTAIDTGKTTALVAFTATADDDFDGPVSVVCSRTSGGLFSLGSTTVTCTARDGSSNVASGTFTITVRDLAPPTICCPADMVMPPCRGAAGMVVAYAVLYSDNLPGATLTCVPPSMSLFPVGPTRVQCTARDASGNTTSCSFKVTVPDRDRPVITVPPHIIVSNDLGQCSAIVNYSVRVSDSSSNVTLQCLPASGSTFPIGRTKVNCTATDSSGNYAKASFYVTVIDKEKPVLILPQDITHIVPNCGPGAVVNYSVTATDNCGTPTIHCSPKSGSNFRAGTNVVRCTVKDRAHNTVTGSFKVIVRDAQPPEIKYIKVEERRLPSPNGDTYAVTVRVNAKDESGPVTSRITSITSGTPGAPATDIQITGPLTARLKSGHTYTINVEVSDISGNITPGTATITLPLCSK